MLVYYLTDYYCELWADNCTNHAFIKESGDPVRLGEARPFPVKPIVVKKGYLFQPHQVLGRAGRE